MNTSNTNNNNANDVSNDAKSTSSRSTRGSAVLQRAREYNRIIDENRTRSKSFEREQNRSTSQPRGGGVSTDSQRDRAMASVQNESAAASKKVSSSKRNATASSSQRYRSSPTPSQKSSNRYRNSPSRASPSVHGASQSRTGTNAKSAAGKSSRGTKATEDQGCLAIVTPELLVDALSGHEDGLLAIAERLMEHYDSGYDAMGEAIIDAFADVQKLFQHVVEAAHMEGAAYEAGRKEEEIDRLKRALGGEANGGNGRDMDGAGMQNGNSGEKGDGRVPNSSLRHEEFIDQDVRDVLSEAIRKGQAMKDSSKYSECFRIYEQACNNASSLLPVDSDHRGRLQLSIARAESMSAERACAILRYVMDDVLRSGLNSNSKVVMPDPSQRGDCVLTKPEGAGIGRFTSGQGIPGDDAGVSQSSEEALNSMVEEMKEILSAPVYDNSPLQGVAVRFWAALSESQRSTVKDEEKLEQKLGILKAEFLLAREEWEEKFNLVSHKCNNYKKRLDKMKQANYMEQARAGVADLGTDYDSDEDDESFRHPHSPSNLDSPHPTHVSGSSSFVSAAKNLVGSFGCNRGKSKSGQGDSSPPSAASTYTTRKSMSTSSTSNYTRR